MLICLSLSSLADRCCSEWDHFGTNEPCPYHFSAEEIRQHYEEAGSFNKSQELWKQLRGVLTDEGYASNESFSKAVKILGDLREVGLDDLKGEERRSFDNETRWVADLDGHTTEARVEIQEHPDKGI